MVATPALASKTAFSDMAFALWPLQFLQNEKRVKMGMQSARQAVAA